MKKEWRYMSFLGIAALIYLGIKLFGPRELDWSVTFHDEDKNPFGGYVIHQLAQDVFPEHPINHSMLTLYEIYDSISEPVNFISISERFSPDKNDLNALLENVDKGGNAFLSAQYFWGAIQDTLHVRTYDYSFQSDYSPETYNHKDTASLEFKNPSLNNGHTYLFPRNNIYNYFVDFDSTLCQVEAVNDLGLPVTIRMKWGKGNLYFNSTPLAFTNAYILHEHNPEFASRTLSMLAPQQPVYWSQYYQFGRMEAQSPLRYVLTTEPLKWAYYLTAISLIIFMIFEAKRKQRIIPVIPPLTNTSLEFVETIGTLYFQHGDHKDIADKKISFLLEFIRSNYWVNTKNITPDFILTVTKRSGNSQADVEQLFQYIAQLQSRQKISPEELIELNTQIERFHSKAKR